MSLPSNLDYLLVQLELIEHLNVVDCLLSQVVALLISECIETCLSVFLCPSDVELLDDLIDLCVG